MARKTDTFFFIVSGYLFKDRLNVDAFVAQAAAYDEVAGASRTGRTDEGTEAGY